MELKDLKSVWDKYSSQEVNKHRLGKESIHELLRNRTKTLVERIDRNIRIGLWILLAFIAFILFDDLYLSKIVISKFIKYPTWLSVIDVFSNALIVTTYLFFLIRYLKIKRNFSVDLHLKDLLGGILDTLKTYRRMFYLAVVILLLNMVVSFSAGLYEGVKYKAESIGGGLGHLSISKILQILGVGFAVLIPLIAGTFLVLRWGFNKLYGRYMVSLKGTLRELDESEEPEN